MSLGVGPPQKDLKILRPRSGLNRRATICVFAQHYVLDINVSLTKLSYSWIGTASNI